MRNIELNNDKTTIKDNNGRSNNESDSRCLKDAEIENDNRIDLKNVLKILNHKDYKPTPPPKPKRTTISQQKHPLLCSLSADNPVNQQHYHGTLMNINSGLLYLTISLLSFIGLS